MAFFPMFFDLEGKNILVVGAGIVGSRRIDVLIQMGALVTVVASSASESVIRWSKEGKIQLILSDYRKYRETHILQNVEKKNSCEPLFMILAVTGDLEVDELAASDGRNLHAFVNVAGDRAQSDFYFPGIARTGIITAGIIADGINHKLAKQATEQVGAFLHEKFHDIDGSGQK